MVMMHLGWTVTLFGAPQEAEAVKTAAAESLETLSAEVDALREEVTEVRG